MPNDSGDSFLELDQQANRLVDTLELLKQELEAEKSSSESLRELAAVNRKTTEVLADVAVEIRKLIVETNAAGIAGLRSDLEKMQVGLNALKDGIATVDGLAEMAMEIKTVIVETSSDGITSLSSEQEKMRVALDRLREEIATAREKGAAEALRLQRGIDLAWKLAASSGALWVIGLLWILLTRAT